MEQPWEPLANIFTTSCAGRINLCLSGPTSGDIKRVAPVSASIDNLSIHHHIFPWYICHPKFNGSLTYHLSTEPSPSQGRSTFLRCVAKYFIDVFTLASSKKPVVRFVLPKGLAQPQLDYVYKMSKDEEFDDWSDLSQEEEEQNEEAAEDSSTQEPELGYVQAQEEEPEGIPTLMENEVKQGNEHIDESAHWVQLTRQVILHFLNGAAMRQQIID